MDLSTYQLRIFLAVARRLSFTRAAKKLYLTQPAVTAQIHKLEKAAGAPLFEQLGRRVALTPAGQVLCRYAEQMLSLEEELRGALADISGQCQGPLGIGASTTIGVSFLPGLLQRFLAQYPRVTLRLYIGNVQEVAHQVLEGQMDLGLIAGEYKDERLDSLPFMEDELILVAPPTHRWAAEPGLEPRQLTGEPFILRERGSTTRTLVEQELAAAGATLNAVAEMNNNEAIAQAVKLGLGVSVVSKYAVAGELKDGRLWQVPLAGVNLRRTFNIVIQKEKHRTPAMRAFQDLLGQLAAEPAQPAAD